MHKKEELTASQDRLSPEAVYTLRQSEMDEYASDARMAERKRCHEIASSILGVQPELSHMAILDAIERIGSGK